MKSWIVWVGKTINSISSATQGEHANSTEVLGVSDVSLGAAKHIIAVLSKQLQGDLKQRRGSMNKGPKCSGSRLCLSALQNILSRCCQHNYNVHLIQSEASSTQYRSARGLGCVSRRCKTYYLGVVNTITMCT